MTRCVNFDWLEIFCVEQQGFPARTSDYYAGVYGSDSVNVRAYGTPMYADMFTVCEHGHPIFEIRRNPLSKISEGGLFPDTCCHIRLSNRACYYPDPCGLLLRFIHQHHINFVSTKRVDLCMDFNHFDTGENPATFLRDYFANKYAKINQISFDDHGRDAWEVKAHNSAKWRSQSAGISTKLYNKTEELRRQGHDKPYIRAAWSACGLDTNTDVWRVEFAIQPVFKNLVKTETGETMPCDILMFRTRDMISELFFMLADRYFDFRVVETLADGTIKRKDRSRRKVLFKIKNEDKGWKPEKPLPEKKAVNTRLLNIIKELCRLADDQTRVKDFEHILFTADYIIRNYECDDFTKSWAHNLLAVETRNKYAVASPSFFDEKG